MKEKSEISLGKRNSFEKQAVFKASVSNFCSSQRDAIKKSIDLCWAALNQSQLLESHGLMCLK